MVGRMYLVESDERPSASLEIRTLFKSTDVGYKKAAEGVMEEH